MSKTGLSSHTAQQAKAKQNFTWLLTVETIHSRVSQATDKSIALEVMDIQDVSPKCIKSMGSECVWGDVQPCESLPDVMRPRTTEFTRILGPPLEHLIPFLSPNPTPFELAKNNP